MGCYIYSYFTRIALDCLSSHMATSNLSNYQLYALLQNRGLDGSIHEQVKTELERRRLSAEEWERLRRKYVTHYPLDDGPGLSIGEKLLLILVPAVFTLQVLWATRDLASHKRRRWKDFWFYVSIGYFVWKVVILLLVRWLKR